MLNQKQFGCLKFLSLNFNDQHTIGKLKSKNFFYLQSKNFPPDKRHPGHRSRYGKYGPRSGYGFLRTACQPIRIENFENPIKVIIPDIPMLTHKDEQNLYFANFFYDKCICSIGSILSSILGFV
jgi:hypothetical protein